MKNKTLWHLKTGDSAVLASFSDDMPGKYQQRVEELGFYLDAPVTCVKSPWLGAPKVFRVNSAVFALEKSVANRIHVR